MTRCVFLAWLAVTQLVSSLSAATPLLKSASGRFYVDGPDENRNQILLRWAEEMESRTEQVLGATLPFKSRPILIRVAVNDAAAVPLNTHSNAASRCISLREYGDIDLENTREAACRLFLDDCLEAKSSLRRSRGVGSTNLVETTGASTVPAWFLAGVCENLAPSLRAANIADVAKRWRSGQLKPVAELFTDQLDPDKPLDKPACGMIFTWLISQKEGASVMGNWIGRLASGEKPDATWLLDSFPDCKNSVELDEAWDAWLLHQKRTVYNPGAFDPRFLELLLAELTVLPGNGSAPRSVNDGATVSLRRLIELRSKKWVQSMAKERSIRLKMLAAGRGGDAATASEAYCSFFDALGSRWTRKSTLEKLLKTAERRLFALEYIQALHERKED